MLQHAISLLQVLRVDRTDILGFLIGSLMSHQVALDRPTPVRRPILVDSTPRAGVGMATLTLELQASHGIPCAHPEVPLLDVFYPVTVQTCERARLLSMARRAQGPPRRAEPWPLPSPAPDGLPAGLRARAAERGQKQF